MKSYLYAAVLMMSISFKAFAQSDVSTARWLKQPVTVDGKATEWNQPLAFYDADTRLFFAVANDSSTLYLCFESKDEMSQAKLMRGGMKITLSTKGKPKHEVSVTYPLSSKPSKEVMPDKEVQNTGETMVRDKSSFRQHFLQTHALLDAEGFATAKGPLPLMNATGVIAAMNWDTASNLIYEIAIPKKELFGDDYRNSEAIASALTLDVIINALPKEEAPKDNQSHASHGDQPPNAEAPGGRRGQFNGGGYGTGNEGMRPEPGAGGDNVSLRSKSSFKQKFVLAKVE